MSWIMSYRVKHFEWYKHAYHAFFLLLIPLPCIVLSEANQSLYMQAVGQRRLHLRGWQGWHIRVPFETVVV